MNARSFFPQCSFKSVESPSPDRTIYQWQRRPQLNALSEWWRLWQEGAEKTENLSGLWTQINSTPWTFVIHRSRRSEGEPFIPRVPQKKQLKTSFEAAAVP